MLLRTRFTATLATSVFWLRAYCLHELTPLVVSVDHGRGGWGCARFSEHVPLAAAALGYSFGCGSSRANAAAAVAAAATDGGGSSSRASQRRRMYVPGKLISRNLHGWSHRLLRALRAAMTTAALLALCDPGDAVLLQVCVYMY